jgi:hypothetical protein
MPCRLRDVTRSFSQQSPTDSVCYSFLWPLAAVRTEANRETDEKSRSPNKVGLDPIPSFAHIRYAPIHNEVKQ